MEFEAAGKAQIRGMSEEKPNLQCFEIFIPEELLSKYKTEYLFNVNNAIDQTNNELMAKYNTLQKQLTAQPAIPHGLDLEELELKSRQINKVMMMYIEQVRQQP